MDPLIIDRARFLLDLSALRGLKIATAESCTGGMVTACLTEIPGSSRVLDRGFVTYSIEAKVELLGVSRELIDTCDAVSEPAAAAMAEGAIRRSGADMAVAVTGVAGPGDGERQREGTVCFAIALRNGATETETVRYGPVGRQAVRSSATIHAIELLTSLAASASGSMNLSQ